MNIAKICQNGMIKFYDKQGVYYANGFYHAKHIERLKNDFIVIFA